MPFLVRTLRSAARVSLARPLALLTLLGRLPFCQPRCPAQNAAPGANTDPNLSGAAQSDLEQRSRERQQSGTEARQPARSICVPARSALWLRWRAR